MRIVLAGASGKARRPAARRERSDLSPHGAGGAATPHDTVIWHRTCEARNMARELHCYEYVRVHFDRVREALLSDAVGLFERATHAATGRARAIASSLKVSVAGLDIGKNVVIRVTGIHPHAEGEQLSSRAIRLDLEWHAETSKSLFPSMRASLLASAFGDETRLDLRGTYEPPGGVLGSAADQLLGRRIAEASVHRFLDEVASRLREELG
jgi:hypothetical protein